MTDEATDEQLEDYRPRDRWGIRFAHLLQLTGWAAIVRELFILPEPRSVLTVGLELALVTGAAGVATFLKWIGKPAP